MPDPETGDASLQRFLRAGRILPLQDAANDVVDVALVPLLHGGGVVALAFGLRAVLADNGPADDFDFGDVVMGLGCVVEHRVDQVVLVTMSGMLLSFTMGAARLFQRGEGREGKAHSALIFLAKSM